MCKNMSLTPVYLHVCYMLLKKNLVSLPNYFFSIGVKYKRSIIENIASTIILTPDGGVEELDANQTVWLHTMVLTKVTSKIKKKSKNITMRTVDKKMRKILEAFLFRFAFLDKRTKEGCDHGTEGRVVTAGENQLI